MARTEREDPVAFINTDMLNVSKSKGNLQGQAMPQEHYKGYAKARYKEHAGNTLGKLTERANWKPGTLQITLGTPIKTHQECYTPTSQ